MFSDGFLLEASCSFNLLIARSRLEKKNRETITLVSDQPRQMADCHDPLIHYLSRGMVNLSPFMEGLTADDK
jgi:hypothetical protein